MPYILSTAKAFPKHYHSQQTLSELLREAWITQGLDVAIFDRLQKAVSVQGRYLSCSIEEYRAFQGFGDSNRAWIRVALEVGEEVLRGVLEGSGLEAKDIAMLMSTTVTGISVPSIEARLMNKIPFSPHLKRLPLFGLGCLAGTAGVARIADYLKGHPEEAAILLSIELCSLTLQREDLSIANIISSGLFGDGAAGVALVGDNHPSLQEAKKEGRAVEVLDSLSLFFPDSENVMGWEITDTGMKIILSPGVPGYTRDHLRPAVEQLLKQNQLEFSDIKKWVTHPGGPKVIQAMEKALELPPEALDITRRSLQDIGNLSSSSILIILDETLKTNPPAPGSYGVMISMGPAFCSELVLLRW